jgi:hypothetical protein
MFPTSDNKLQINTRAVSSDTPTFAESVVYMQIDASAGVASLTGNLVLSGDISAANINSGQYIATNEGATGPVGTVITDRIVWNRADDVVAFAGTLFVITSNSAGTVQINLSLPVATTLPDSSYLRGAVQIQDTTKYAGVSSLFMIGNTITMTIGLTKDVTASVTYSLRFSGTYQVI